MNQAGLHLLLTRSSCGLLQAPAPSGDVLEHILQAGLRAPDHGHLQPFQFLLAEGEGLQRLGRLLAASAKQDGASDELIERAEQMPLRAPMVITVVACRPPFTSMTSFTSPRPRTRAFTFTGAGKRILSQP